ncbi:MAG: hypothetical protein R3175_07520 [Marinobacter sp.]|uniref:hypothetical protein n=1 Tax=Marinobacter sp. TaxID=50741 RepID=UPI00299CFA55|nr:hypothetical protein [Marinobacter sp.]MDX1755889.1 hypothetical protein [Marinobacter sp.]
MNNLELRLKLTADNQGVSGVVRKTEADVDRLNRTMDNTSATSSAGAQSLKKLTSVGHETTRMFQLQKGALQQAGYQFQDFFVQVGSGTSAFTALGQQGSQLLGILGPGGALLGAGLAIASVFGGVVYSAFGDAAEGAGHLEDILEDLDTIITRTQGGALVLADEILQLAEASQTAAKLEIAGGILKAEDAVNASVARTRETLEGAFGNFTIDFSDALAQVQTLESQGKSLQEQLEIGERFGTPGIVLGINLIKDELDELREQFGISRQDGVRLFEALSRAQANPTIENLEGMEQVVTEIGLALKDTSPAFVRLAKTLGQESRQTRQTVEAKNELEAAYQRVNEAVTESRETLDGESSQRQRLIESALQHIEFLELQNALIAEGITVREAARLAEREGQRQELEAAGVTQERIEQLFQLEDAVIAAADAEQEAKERQVQARREAAAAAREEAKAQAEAARAQEQWRNQAKALVNELDPLGAQFESVYEKQQMLIRLAAEGKISEGYRDQLITTLVEGMADAGEIGAGEWEESFRSAADTISRDLQDAIISGDFEGIGDAIGNVLAGGISYAVSSAITNNIGNLGNNLSSQLIGTFAGPIGGAVAGGLVGLAINELGDYLNDYTDPTEQRQASQGTGTVLGSINDKTQSIVRSTDLSATATEQLVGINRSMLDALLTVQTGIDGASTRIARGADGVSINAPSVDTNFFDSTVGQLIGGSFDAIGSIVTLGLANNLGEIIGKALGGRSKQVDEGVRIVGGYIADLAEQTVVQAYSTFKVKKNFLDDYDTKEKFASLDGDVSRQFAAVFGDILDSVAAGADALGVLPGQIESRLEQFVVDTQRISLEDLNAEEQKAELQAVFGAIFDDLAVAVIPYLDDFQRAGEGLGETLARVATQVQVTDEAVDRLGFRFADLQGRDLVLASERLTEAAGGIERFVTDMESFIGNFASESQQFEIASSDITRALEQQGLALPATRDAYFALLQAQDGSTAAGAENIATLLRLQNSADKYYTSLERHQDEALEAQQALVAEQRHAVSARLREAEQAARSIGNALDALTVQTEQFSQAQRTSAFNALRGFANAGAVPAGAELDNALSAATQLNISEFASLGEYIREVAATGEVLGDLDAIAQEQVTVEQRMLDSLDHQTSVIESGQQAQLEALTSLQRSVSQPGTVVAPVVSAAQSLGPLSSSGSLASNAELLVEVRNLKAQLEASQRAIAKHTQRTAKLLERFDIDGIEVRDV